MPDLVSESLNVFVPGPSTDPIPRNNTLTSLLNAAGSAKAPPQVVLGSKVPPLPPQLPLNPPRYANLPRLVRPVVKVCAPQASADVLDGIVRLLCSSRHLLAIVNCSSREPY